MEASLRTRWADFFDNGGARCYVVAANSAADPTQGLVNAIAALAPLEDMDLVAVPDASALAPDTPSIARVQAEMLTHCAQQANRFADSGFAARRERQ